MLPGNEKTLGMMETLRMCFVITARQTEGKEGAEEIVDIESLFLFVWLGNSCDRQVLYTLNTVLSVRLYK